MDRTGGFVCREDCFQKRERQRHLHSLCSSIKIPVTLEYNFIIQRRSICQLMCCPFHAILNPSSVKCILKMRSQCPHSEKVNHLLKGKYIFFSNVLVAGQRVYNTHKKTHYIDRHKTIKLAGKSISLYISIVSQVALNKIQEPHSE